MPKNDIGGFFVSLGLNPDRNSFDTGNKLIDGVTTSINKLIGTARNASVVLTGTAVATGAIESANTKTSAVLGIATTKLDLWKASAKIAGVSADGLVGSMGKLADVMNHLTIDGSGLDAYQEQLGKLGLGIEELEAMDVDKAYETIIAKAQEQAATAQAKITEARKALANNPEDATAQALLKEGQKEQLRVTTIVGDILGDAGQNFYVELQRQGKSIADFLAGAGKTIFTTEADAQKGADFAVQVNTLKAEVESIGKLIGDTAAGIMTPYLDDINKWIQANGPAIRTAVEKTLNATEKVIGKAITTISNFWDKNGDSIKSGISKIVDTTEKIIGKGIETISNWWEVNGDKITDSLVAIGQNVALIMMKLFDLLNKEEVKTVGAAWTSSFKAAIETPGKIIQGAKEGGLKGAADATWDSFKAIMIDPTKAMIGAITGNKMNDGIMRPDGTITQVAPDDWVFAARNVGDLARAFIPQNMTQVQAPAEYVINQSFTINGGNDIPQVLKAQAYRGTQEGLMAIMEQSSRRLELMSGTR